MYKNYFELIDRVDVDTYIKLLEEVGWFSEMTDDKKKEKVDSIIQSYKENKKYTFDNLVDILFDAEGFNMEEGDNMTGYPRLLQHLSEESEGVFSPKNIEEKERGDFFVISFSMGGEKYESEIEMETKWFQNSFMDVVNVALEDSGTKLRFIAPPHTAGQEAEYYFIPKEAHKRALKEKLIPSQFEVDVHL